MKNINSTNESVYKPFKFFFFTFLLTWVSWFLSAYFSFNENSKNIFVVLMIPGLVAPFCIALWMILASKNKRLTSGFRNKLFNLRLIKLESLPAIFLIMPFAVFISILISTFFGESFDQLKFSDGFSFSAGFMPVLLVLFLAASFEELGWRSYAMDSLRVKHNYFTATLMFSVLWAFWHFPLFFIKDYYHYELVKTNLLFAINFMISIIPMAFIISWICQKNEGSITTAIIFHFIINLSQEALQITQITKCIETIVLIVIAMVIVVSNKKMFFDKSISKI
ncbi:MAG: CPBP family glutamic-type intramembrane protease [Tenuifilaceae bacterium]